MMTGGHRLPSLLSETIKNSEDEHHDSEDGHHYAEDESSAESIGLFHSKNSSPQTGDAGADDVTMCSLLLLFSLVSIVVVKRRPLSSIRKPGSN